MNSLSEFKELLIKNKFTIKDYCGWYVTISNNDTWTLLDGILFKNGIALKDQEVKEYLKLPPKESAKRKGHKITPNRC